MRVIFMSRNGFSILVYHHVSSLTYNDETEMYTVTYTNAAGNTATITQSNLYYTAHIMGLSSESETTT